MSETTPVKSSNTKYILAAIAAAIAILGLIYSLISGTPAPVVAPVVVEPVVDVTTAVAEPADVTTVTIPVSEDDATSAAEVTVTAEPATK